MRKKCPHQKRQMILRKNNFNSPSTKNYYRMNRKLSFVEQMRAQLLQFQIQKNENTKTQPNYAQFLKRENLAREALIDVDNEETETEIEEPQICRWASRRGHSLNPHSQTERRAVKSSKSRLTIEVDTQKGDRFDNQRSIPRLKNILKHLTTPVNKPPKSKENQRAKESPAQEIDGLVGRSSFRKGSARSQSNTKIDVADPPKEKETYKDIFLRTQMNTQYQRIRRAPGSIAESEIVHEKQILSSLIGGLAKQSGTVNVLSNLSNYFSVKQKNKVN